MRLGTTWFRLGKQVGEPREEATTEVHEPDKENQEGEDDTHSNKHQLQSFRDHFFRFLGLGKGRQGRKGFARIGMGSKLVLFQAGIGHVSPNLEVCPAARENGEEIARKGHLIEGQGSSTWDRISLSRISPGLAKGWKWRSSCGGAAMLWVRRTQMVFR